ncbi:MAG: transposase, partial [Anaerolineales bacterium]|nr:transposase [Anaerolineales bacterium]
DGAKEAFSQLSADTIASLKKIWADGSYRGDDFLNWVHEVLQSALEITSRPPNTKGFVVVPVRWVIERTLAWLGRYRRLSKDYEHCTKSSEGVIYVASIATMLKRLA